MPCLRAASTGLVAVGGLAVLHSDAHRLYHGLLHGAGLADLIVSVLAGLTALALVLRASYEPSRYIAALAVTAIIAGWALAQRPLLLTGLTIRQAAAPHDTLVLVVVAVLGGAVILFPSLVFLFRLVLSGRLEHGHAEGSAEARGPAPTLISASSAGLAARSAGACLLAGVGLLTLADAGWAHALGVVSLFGFVVLGFVAVGPAQLAGGSDQAGAG